VTGSLLIEVHDDYFVRTDQEFSVTRTEVDPERLDYPCCDASQIKPRFYLAICSEAPLPRFADDLMLDNHGQLETVLQIINKGLTQNSVLVADLQAEIERKNEGLARNSAVIAELEAQIAGNNGK